MPSTQSLTRSLIGRKVLMAVSGVVLLLFVFAHMAGNLHFFEGPERIAAYSRFLRTVGEPVLGYGQALWIVRAALILSVVVHILAAWLVTRAASAAAPRGSRNLGAGGARPPRGTGFSSRWRPPTRPAPCAGAASSSSSSSCST